MSLFARFWNWIKRMFMVNHLSGFGGGGASLSSVSYLTSAGTNTSSVTIPATSRAGDVAVLFDEGRGASAPSLVTPSGWTNLVNTTAGSARMAVFYKILASGEPNTSITGMDGSFGESKLLLVFRPNTPVTTVTPSTFLSEITSGNPASQSAAASGQIAPVIVLGGASDQDTGAPTFTTASPAFDGEVTQAGSGADYAFRMGYKIYNAASAPASHTIDIGDNGNDNGLWSGYLKLA